MCQKCITDEAITQRPVEFKPGNKPYLVFGNEVLNNNMPWHDILTELLATSGMSLSELSVRLETTVSTLCNVVNGNECPLTFKQGARLLTLHERYAED
jgi:lambda repressor-like predicted transcriptional regulator